MQTDQTQKHGSPKASHISWVDAPYMDTFLAWKQRCKDQIDATRDSRGRFTNYLMRTQWAAYRQGVRDALPDKAPGHVIGAMISQGVRPEWVSDVYNEMRKALIDGEPK